ncbi:MAG: hypothetical protein CMB64_04770 [Euryarchaeota archaeon]|nr:hypothetical protein [Euryarchaeota archaeon]
MLKTRIISFDVGVKNMSFCLAESVGKRKLNIVTMQTLALKGKNIQDYTNSLIMQLRKLELGYLDRVLIEQQLNRNTQMKVLSHVIQSYFICERNIPLEDICFYNPKLKFETTGFNEYDIIVTDVKASLNIGDKMSRSEVKKLSIAVTKELLSTSDTFWLRCLEKNDKKDDLSDAYLQAYTYNIDKGDNLSCVVDLMDIDSDI